MYCLRHETNNFSILIDSGALVIGKRWLEIQSSALQAAHPRISKSGEFVLSTFQVRDCSCVFRFRKSFPDTYKEHFPNVKSPSFFNKVKSALPSWKKLVPTRKKSLPTDDEAPRSKGTAGERILSMTSKALESEDYSRIMQLSKEEALLALNLVQKVHISPGY